VSLYRQPGGARARTIAVSAVVALVVGVAIGYAVGRSGEDEPSAQEVVSALREDLRPVSNGLTLLPNEYAQAYGGSGNEAAAVSGALERIQSGLEAAGDDLRTLDPDGAIELSLRLRALEEAVRADRRPAVVVRLAGSAQAALAAVPGGGG